MKRKGGAGGGEGRMEEGRGGERGKGGERGGKGGREGKEGGRGEGGERGGKGGREGERGERGGKGGREGEREERVMEEGGGSAYGNEKEKTFGLIHEFSSANRAVNAGQDFSVKFHQ